MLRKLFAACVLGAFASVAAAQETLGTTGFGADAQALRPFAGLQEGFAKLS